MQILIRIVAGLALACAVAALGADLWLHSRAGQRFILDQLEGATGASIDARRVGGSLFSDLVLEDVTLRARGQPLVVRAERVAIRYALASFLTRDPRIAMDVDASGGKLRMSGPLDDLRVDGTIVASTKARVHAEPGRTGDRVQLTIRARGDYTRRLVDPALPPRLAEKHAEARAGGSYALAAHGSTTG